jgi:N-acetylneuraminic acid mutarotase
MIGRMTEIRSEAGAATLNGKIYVAGGSSMFSNINSAEKYNPEVNQWTYIVQMMFPRRKLSCIAYHCYIYAIGGSMGSVEKNNPTTNEWMQIPDMSYSRYHFGTVVLDDEIFVIGGIRDGPFKNAVEY